tara:strand:- start:5823 stop:6287 length:465 start_codon:yes stop_codon:yes gene_type:complete
MQENDSVQILSFLISIGFAFTFFYSAYKSVRDGRKLSDNIELFRVVDHYEVQPPPVPMSFQAEVKLEPETKKQTTKKKAARNPARQSKTKTKPQPEQNRNHNGYTDLQQDCFDALKALGIKAVRERKFIISNTFNKHNPTTVQDFLQVALHRGA